MIKDKKIDNVTQLQIKDDNKKITEKICNLSLQCDHRLRRQRWEHVGLHIL